jgi:hypothetical protein
MDELNNQEIMAVAAVLFAGLAAFIISLEVG